jgi:5,10-methenyltetrahydromethanopterin hydrogenase
MDWKEQFDNQFPEINIAPERVIQATPEGVKGFISTEIIAKIIDDIPDGIIRLEKWDTDKPKFRTDKPDLKQQLKFKWL